MPTPTSQIEISPGEIWESKHGKHQGLRVQVLSDRGHSVKVKVIRNRGANGGFRMVGQVWSIARDVFITRYEQIDLPPEKPKVETDLGKLLAAMPPAPPIVPTSIIVEKEKEENNVMQTSEVPAHRPRGNYLPAEKRRELALSNFNNEQAQAKRRATLQARADSLTPEQIDEMVRLRDSGESVGELARAYRLGVEQVMSILYGHKTNESRIEQVLAKPPSARADKIREAVKKNIVQQAVNMPANVRAEICERRRNGATYWDLMRDYRLVNGALTTILREGGVPVGDKGYNLSRSHQMKTVKIKVLGTPESPTPVVPEISERKEPEVTEPEVAIAKAGRYVAKVLVMEPVVKEIVLDTDDFEDAIKLAKAIPNVTKVVGVWEAQ